MTKERWVGLFFFVGLVLLIGMSMRVDDEGHFFKGGYARQYHTIMPNIGTVGRGSLVRMGGSGIRIGRVDKVSLVDVADPGTGEKRYEYKVWFSVKDDVNGLGVDIKKDSRARLAMTTILQGMHLEITPGTPDAEVLDVGELVEALESKSLMDTLANLGDVFDGLGDGGLGRMLLGQDGLEKVGKVLDQVAQDGGLGKWVLGEKAQKDLEPTLADLRRTVENVRKGTEGKGTIARLLNDESLGEKVDGTVTDLRESMKGVRKFAADISEGKGVIARLASDDKLGEDLQGIVTDIRGVTADLRAGKSTLSRLISDQEMGDQIAETVASISSFARDLASGEGTIARLIKDPEIADELKKLVSQAREAVEDAREAAPISAFSSLLFGALQ